MNANATTVRRLAQAGKYLTFRLDNEEYGLEILKVQEIIGMLNVTRVPRAPEYVRGVVNLRGKVIPVIDLRLKFGMPTRAYTHCTCIIVVQIARANARVVVGIIVDEVSEVRDIKEDQIEPTPSFGTDMDTEFLLGMGKIDTSVLILLDIDTVLSASELDVAGRMAQLA